jgi:hypothetical protein
MDVFDKARQDMEAGTPDQSDNAQAPSVEATSEEVKSNNQSELAPESNQPSLAELEKLERFKFDGQEWTPKDLKNSILRMNDYTRKTQELAETRKSIETEQLYRDNFQVDFKKVLQNPELIEVFRTYYPAHWVKVAEQLLETTKSHPKASETPNQSTPQGSGLDSSVLKKIDYIEKTFQQREVEALEKSLDMEFTKLTSKYPKANPELALARAQLLSDQRVDILKEGKLEEIFKSLNDIESTREKQWRENLIKEQKQANAKARDIGKGGGTPGKAPEKMDFRQAREHMLKGLGAQ